MSPADWHRLAVILELVLAAATFLLLLRVTAPYGRHLRDGWGPRLPARLGWLIMESPAVLAVAVIYVTGPLAGNTPSLALLSLWMAHYLHRTLVYPLVNVPVDQAMPWLIVLSAVAFNSLNAWVNAGWIAWFADYPADWLTDPRFLVGAALFGLGMGINRWADHRLRRLRRAAGRRVLPHGGLFDHVCCPNYLGEIIAWFGWALATASLAGLAFALYTLANLLPRALDHRRWYREHFPEFPRRRAALVPGLI